MFIKLSIVLASIATIIGIIMIFFPYISPADETKKQHNGRRWFMAIMCGALIVFQVCSYQQKDEEDSQREEANIHHCDSVNNALQKDTKQFITETFVVNSHTTIEKPNTKPAVKPNPNNSPTKLPSLYLEVGNGAQMELLKDKNLFHFILHTRDATAYNINLKASFVISSDYKTFTYGGKQIFSDNNTLVENRALDVLFGINTDIRFEYFIVWISGDYTSATDKTKIRFDEWLNYSMIEDKVYILGNEVKPEVFATINENENKSQ